LELFPEEVLKTMAKITVLFALMLVALGLLGYVGPGSTHPTALIPTWIGLALGLFGALSFSPDAGRRKLFMHINVTIALLGFLGSVGEIIRGYVHSAAVGVAPNAAALGAKWSLAGLLLVYVILCVRSFIAARRSGVV
jgi:hypothetical protein